MKYSKSDWPSVSQKYQKFFIHFRNFKILFEIHIFLLLNTHVRNKNLDALFERDFPNLNVVFRVEFRHTKAICYHKAKSLFCCYIDIIFLLKSHQNNQFNLKVNHKRMNNNNIVTKTYGRLIFQRFIQSIIIPPFSSHELALSKKHLVY